MRPDQWQAFKAAAKRQNRSGPIPLALIVDCPWIPPYGGISQWDYFFDMETWFRANVKVQRESPARVSPSAAVRSSARRWPNRIAPAKAAS